MGTHLLRPSIAVSKSKAEPSGLGAGPPFRDAYRQEAQLWLVCANDLRRIVKLCRFARSHAEALGSQICDSFLQTTCYAGRVVGVLTLEDVRIAE